jgi:hypothetical protein
VFVKKPFGFEDEYRRAYVGEVAPGVLARFVSLPALIRMKKEAAREKDIDDVRHLELLWKENP